MSLKSRFVWAVETLKPGVGYTLGSGQTLPDLYNTLFMEVGDKPTYAQIEEALQAHDLAQVHQQRKTAYPPVEAYLDAQVKIASSDPTLQADGQAQLAAYLTACLDVKTAHPKPIGEM